jgi:hypothetical protein
MSSLFMNLRLFGRLPAFMHASRMNVTTTTSSKIDPPADLVKPNRHYVKIGAVVVGIVGLYTMIRMSRKEEQLIAHSIDKQPHSSTASSK